MSLRSIDQTSESTFPFVSILIEGPLVGELSDGAPIEGKDTVKIVFCD